MIPGSCRGLLAKILFFFLRTEQPGQEASHLWPWSFSIPATREARVLAGWGKRGRGRGKLGDVLTLEGKRRQAPDSGGQRRRARRPGLQGGGAGGFQRRRRRARRAGVRARGGAGQGAQGHVLGASQRRRRPWPPRPMGLGRAAGASGLGRGGGWVGPSGSAQFDRIGFFSEINSSEKQLQ
jgi:hypothetical protein